MKGGADGPRPDGHVTSTMAEDALAAILEAAAPHTTNAARGPSDPAPGVPLLRRRCSRVADLPAVAERSASWASTPSGAAHGQPTITIGFIRVRRLTRPSLVAPMNSEAQSAPVASSARAIRSSVLWISSRVPAS